MAQDDLSSQLQFLSYSFELVQMISSPEDPVWDSLLHLICLHEKKFSLKCLGC